MTLVIANGSVPSRTQDGTKVSASVALLPGEQKKIDDAVENLAADPHALRDLSLRVSVNVHREYPKYIDGVTVENEAEEKAARAQMAAKKADAVTE